MLDDIDRIFDIPARFIDINYSIGQLTTISTKDGVSKDISLGEVEGFGVRVLDKTWGFASSNNPDDLFDAATRAYKASKSGNNEIPFAPVESTVAKVEPKVKLPPADITLEDKIALSHRAFDSIKDKKHVVSSSFQYSDSQAEGLYANSEGSRIEWKDTKIAFFASIFAKKGPELQIGSERVGATAGFEFIENTEKIALKAADKAIKLLGAQNAPSGRFTVVLDPLLTGVFIHEAMGHAVEADHVIQGDSILEGMIGESLTNEYVTMFDDPTIEGSFGYYLYDDEGTKGKRTPIIEKGILRNFLHSRETSSTLDMVNTGNARSQGPSHVPVVRMSNTFLEPKDQTFEELIEGIDHGVFLLGSKGGEVDPAKGVFQFSAEEGFLIEKGELTKHIKDVALSGETLSILKDIDAVGKDFESHIGFCGKDGQSVPVGDGGPHIRTIAAVGGLN